MFNIKHIFFLTYLIVLFSNCHQPKLLYVTANDSLSLREEPSVYGKIILTIPRGTLVKTLDEIDKQITVNERNGKWTKITVFDNIGWVFGGYLSEDIPPEKPILPPLPITINYRDSIWGKGYVLILNNQSRHYLQIQATFHNPTFKQTAKFSIDVPPYDKTEFGWQEGWKFSHGETILLEHADYLPIRTKF